MKKLWRSPHEDLSAIQKPKKQALLLALRFTIFAFFLQTIGVFFTNSLALLGDTVHIFTDAFSLGLSLSAVLLSQQAPDEKRSFGFFRLEVLASFLNGLLLFAVATGIIFEALKRFTEPKEILPLPLLIISSIGLLLNLLSAWYLHQASKEGLEYHHHGHGHSHEHIANLPSDRNLRGPILHILSDALGSVAVIVGAIFVLRTGHFWIDSAIGIVLAALIYYWSFYQLRDSLHVLLEGTPRHISVERLEQEILATDMRIKKIDDLHVWEITSRMYTMTMYLHVEEMSLETADLLRGRIEKLLLEKFGISHCTIGVKGE